MEKLMRLINKERNKKAAKEAALQLFELCFAQYDALLYNCEMQYLKLMNLELCKSFEPSNNSNCQFIMVVLVRAGIMCRIASVFPMAVGIR